MTIVLDTHHSHVDILVGAWDLAPSPRIGGRWMTIASTAIAGTTSDEQYCKERYFHIWELVHNVGMIFQYHNQLRIQCPNVLAKRVYKTTGQRVVEVWVNGQEVMSALDSVDVDGCGTALIVPVIAKVTIKSNNHNLCMNPVGRHRITCFRDGIKTPLAISNAKMCTDLASTPD